MLTPVKSQVFFIVYILTLLTILINSLFQIVSANETKYGKSLNTIFGTFLLLIILVGRLQGEIELKLYPWMYLIFGFCIYFILNSISYLSSDQPNFWLQKSIYAGQIFSLLIILGPSGINGQLFTRYAVNRTILQKGLSKKEYDQMVQDNLNNNKSYLKARAEVEAARKAELQAIKDNQESLEKLANAQKQYNLTNYNAQKINTYAEQKVENLKKTIEKVTDLPPPLSAFPPPIPAKRLRGIATLADQVAAGRENLKPIPDTDGDIFFDAKSTI